SNHALYKSALFLLIGWFEKAARTRNIGILDLEHWARHYPGGAALFGIGALAMVGGPFLMGFVSKKLFYEVVLHDVQDIPFLPVVVFIASVLTVAAALKMFVTPFWGENDPFRERLQHEVGVTSTGI